ncbi:MAG: hypothetical protein DRJ03_17025 [Chloroflexi bacterium]|nr:MAG: hypothetical protein DRJ03_17025 [Chloroflexota bacterium]
MYEDWAGLGHPEEELPIELVLDTIEENLSWGEDALAEAEEALEKEDLSEAKLLAFESRLYIERALGMIASLELMELCQEDCVELKNKAEDIKRVIADLLEELG